MSDNLVNIIGAILMCGVLWLAVQYAGRRARAEIEEWATRNNFRLVSLRWGPPWSAPFEKLPARSLQTRATYRAVLLAPNGDQKQAWIAYHSADNDSLFTKDLQLPKVMVKFEYGEV